MPDYDAVTQCRALLDATIRQLCRLTYAAGNEGAARLQGSAVLLKGFATMDEAVRAGNVDRTQRCKDRIIQRARELLAQEQGDETMPNTTSTMSPARMQAQARLASSAGQEA